MVSTLGTRRVLPHNRLLWFSFEELVAVFLLEGLIFVDMEPMSSIICFNKWPDLYIYFCISSWRMSNHIKTLMLDELIIQEVILLPKFTSKQEERQVVIASRLKVIVINIFQVQVTKLVVVARFIGVSRPRQLYLLFLHNLLLHKHNNNYRYNNCKDNLGCI
ncbi:MAG: hypothetical protein EZS28_003487 [Streblomastix strix]|uniref:Uncharacterized protein n=1 Tax=Streblomastix strix TaxID=222440 RepID=A0A5J4X2K3_9EUKA|nr:MAG: hypothetical protein EZS28_003487 [Streblomastix strix]